LLNGIFEVDVGSKFVRRFEEVTKERAGDNSGAKCSLTTDAGDIAFAFPSVLGLDYVVLFILGPINKILLNCTLVTSSYNIICSPFYV